MNANRHHGKKNLHDADVQDIKPGVHKISDDCA
jgi:hypothetical protein